SRGAGQGADRLVPRHAGRLQGAEEDRLRPAVQDLYRQNPEVPAARAGARSSRPRGPAMSQLGAGFSRMLDELNPYNSGNLLLYFTWLVVYTYTAVAIWRSRRPWFRFLCFVVNQLFSVGVILSWTLTGLLAYTYWRESLGALGGTAVLSFARFHWPRPRVAPGPAFLGLAPSRR